MKAGLIVVSILCTVGAAFSAGYFFSDVAATNITAQVAARSIGYEVGEDQGALTVRRWVSELSDAEISMQVSYAAQSAAKFCSTEKRGRTERESCAAAAYIAGALAYEQDKRRAYN